MKRDSQGVMHGTWLLQSAHQSLLCANEYKCCSVKTGVGREFQEFSGNVLAVCDLDVERKSRNNLGYPPQQHTLYDL